MSNPAHALAANWADLTYSDCVDVLARLLGLDAGPDFDDGGPLGDLLDALAKHRPVTAADLGYFCAQCSYRWPCEVGTARDAVVAALTGDPT